MHCVPWDVLPRKTRRPPVTLANGTHHVAHRKELGPAVVYARISMQHDERTASLDSQSEYAVALARAEGYTLAEDDLFTERYTGVDSSYDRPVLVEIRKRIDAGRYKALICYATDRLARTPEELLAIVSDAKRCGCKTLFVKNPTPDTKEGKLLLAHELRMVPTCS